MWKSNLLVTVVPLSRNHRYSSGFLLNTTVPLLLTSALHALFGIICIHSSYQNLQLLKCMVNCHCQIFQIMAMKMQHCYSVEDLEGACQAKRTHKIVQIDFDNYTFSPFLRGVYPLRHPLSAQVMKFYQSLIWAPPLFKNPGSAPAPGYHEIHLICSNSLL